MSRHISLKRTARGGVAAIVIALAAAAPAAAAQPTRTVIVAGPSTHYPAGTGCDFDVTVYRPKGGWTAITDFTDGREAIVNHAVERTITNDATGATFVEVSSSHEVDVIIDGDYHGTITGSFIWQFYPGDVGPDGTVLDHLLALYVHGSATYVVSGEGVTEQITIHGTTTDICAAIS
jgi:anaerobic selenocysteine-containing dehydrogenase